MNTTNTQDPIPRNDFIARLRDLAATKLADTLGPNHMALVLTQEIAKVADDMAAQPQGDATDHLKLHAIEELCQLGYTVKDGELFPPDHLADLMLAAKHPLAVAAQPQGDAREAFEAWYETPAVDGWPEWGIRDKLEASFNAGAAWQATQASEPSRPDILEKLTYHALERDDLTLDDCLEYLAAGWRKVHGRTERQMVLQLTALLAGQPTAPAQASEPVSRCAQCKKEYRHGKTCVGCPKCAPGVSVSESEFQKPIAAQSSEPSADPLWPTDGLYPDMTTPATQRDRWMFDQGRLAERRMAAPARAVEPLTDEKLLSMWSGGDERFMRPVLGGRKVLAFARAIERAHGIGIPDTTPTQAAQPPANCRQRLKADGKPYPRSSCQACGQLSPKWRECDALLAAQGASNE